MSKITKIIIAVIAVAVIAGIVFAATDTPEEVEDVGTVLVEEESSELEETPLESEVEINTEDEETLGSESVEESTEVETSAPAETNTSTDGGDEAVVLDEPVAATAAAVVTYDGARFTPAEVTIVAGETVRFVNESGRAMWVASDFHPTHTEYSGTSRSEHCDGSTTNAFDQCGAGKVYEFTFEKAGTFGYHNHLNPAAGGTVIVTAQ